MHASTKDILGISALIIVFFLWGLYRINRYRVEGIFSLRNILVELAIWVIVTLSVVSGCHGSSYYLRKLF